MPDTDTRTDEAPGTKTAIHSTEGPIVMFGRFLIYTRVWRVGVSLLALAIAAHTLLFAGVASADTAEAKKIFTTRCMACHTFGKGVKVEVGDMLPSAEYAKRLKRVPKAWEKAFEVNPGESEAVRASCIEFVLAGLYATDRISRSQKHGRISYEIR